MLAAKDWQWDDGNRWLVSTGEASHLYANGPDGYEYTLADIQEMKAFGGDQAVQYVVRLDDGDYASMSNLVSALVPDSITVDATEWLGESGDCLIAFHGPSTGEALACAFHSEDADSYFLDAFNPRAVEQGMFDEWWGEDCGRSVDEVWHYLFGHGPGEEPAEVPSEALDANGNPTLPAITELSGAELCDMLVSEGWWWNSDRLWFTSPDGEGHLYAFGLADYEYTYSDLQGLSAFGVGEPVQYYVLVSGGGYSSVEDALSALVPDVITVDAIEWTGDLTACLVAFHGPSTGEAIAEVFFSEESDKYGLIVFNPEAIEQGLFDEWWGDSCGSSVDEVWNTLFGHTPGN